MLTVKIQEERCIGCSKCIPACPVDAIIGSKKLMHSVITNECIGCKLCIEPCPVDCIELLPEKIINKEEKIQKAQFAKKRYIAKQERLRKEEPLQLPVYNKEQIQKNLQAALLRAKNKQKNQTVNQEIIDSQDSQ